MTIIKRTVDSGVVEREERQIAQAALNSDGCMTIRGYNYNSPVSEKETMIILSRNETRAIFDLMKEIGTLAKTDLPF